MSLHKPVSVHLNPSLVHHLFHHEVLPVVRQNFPFPIGDEITRYGMPVGSVIHAYESLDRGMDEARRLIADHEAAGLSFPSGTVVVAEKLTAGKGRFQRSWHAPPGGLWMTLIIVNTLLPENARLYPLAAGVSCCELLRQYGVDCRIKWVNDILASGKKICGILVETVYGPRSGEEYFLIGIGLNVNNESFPTEIASQSISMKQYLGAVSDVHLAAARLLAWLAWYDGLLRLVEATRLAGGGYESEQPPLLKNGHPLICRWRELSDTIGRHVRYGFNVRETPQYAARVLGITEEGGLIMQPAGHDATITEFSGEVEYLAGNPCS